MELIVYTCDEVSYGELETVLHTNIKN